MVAGHLQEKKGLFYIVLNYNDSSGKRKTKWMSTGLKVKGNKKKADLLLQEARRTFVPPTIASDHSILFCDFLKQWLDIHKSTFALSTYSGYAYMVDATIAPYFREKQIKLVDLETAHLQEFYTMRLKTVKVSTVIHDHAMIQGALKYAVKKKRIPVNPAIDIERPKKDAFVGSFYDSQEMQALFNVSKGSKLEIPILFGGFYGLRRSEIVGLKWSNINFETDTITIKHTVISCTVNGERVVQASDKTKTTSSMRTLPLVPTIKESLLAIQTQQNTNRKLCGKSYCTDYLQYVCVNELGVRIRPSYITTAFPKLLEKNTLRRIRFHDLRHSCASLLLANNVPMKQIQEWLGHSDYATTANVYAHLDCSAKIASARAMEMGLNMPNKNP